VYACEKGGIMKLAKKIFSDILTDLMDRRGIKTQFQLVRDDGPRDIWDELVVSNESIISAKLEPIREALQRIVGLDDGTVVLHEDYVLERIGDVLAMFDDE